MAFGISVPQPGIEPRPLAAKVQSSNRWTAREFPFFFIYLFLLIVVVVVALGCHCCQWAFSSRGEWATLRCRARTSHCCSFSCCRARARRHTGLAAVIHELSCPVASGIFPNQGSNLCPLLPESRPCPLGPRMNEGTGPTLMARSETSVQPPAQATCQGLPRTVCSARLRARW